MKTVNYYNAAICQLYAIIDNSEAMFRKRLISYSKKRLINRNANKMIRIFLDEKLEAIDRDFHAMLFGWTEEAQAEKMLQTNKAA